MGRRSPEGPGRGPRSDPPVRAPAAAAGPATCDARNRRAPLTAAVAVSRRCAAAAAGSSRRPRPGAVRRAGLGQPFEQHARSQTFANLEGLRESRRLRLEQLAGEPLIITCPVAEEPGSTAFARLTGSQALDGIERLVRLCNRRVLGQGAPHQPQSRLPRERQRNAVTFGVEQRKRLLARLLGPARIARRTGGARATTGTWHAGSGKPSVASMSRHRCRCVAARSGSVLASRSPRT